ncbi:substrate-binding periplasmic protein [Chitinimonas koreensis]|uniref:substrate-binding periplasmic protein n=1 Tax=Chitinimonas koreensis TaxID=356302 RepID=UPI0009FBE8B0|nr:ABC transporter substrate-binding protein [Chitinimonas koreensis]QNM97950.1 transporter substrate-binding domain-containing protein [Chitinimonas koreensis]
MKKASSSLGSALLCSAATWASAAGAAPYVLMFDDNPPFVIVEGNRYRGVALDVVARLFERAKLDYRWQQIPAVRGLELAKVQARKCVFPVQRAQDIEADYQWISPVLITHSGLFARPDANLPIHSLSDARGYTIGVLRGSGDAEYLKRFGYSVDEATTQGQNLQKLFTRRFDLWATDLLSAEHFRRQSPDGQAPKELLVFRTSLGSLACNRKMPKADAARLQQALDAMIQEGTLEKLLAGGG